MNKDPHRRFPRRALLYAATVAALVVLVGFQSNTVDTRRYGPSCTTWLMQRWREGGGTLSFAWLLPLISLGLVWKQRNDIQACRKGISHWGLVIVLLALALHIIGYHAMLPRLNVVAMIGLLWGIPFYLYGWPLAKQVLFPCAYLLLGIPYGFLDRLTFPLRLFGCRISTAVLNGLGVACTRQGTIIESVQQGGFRLNVIDACSGLRYILVILALTACYAYLMRGKAWKKWVVFLTSPLLAIAGNVFRIIVVGLAARFFGHEFAVGLYHDYSGYIVFVVVVALMLLLAGLLNINYLDKLKEWKKRSKKLSA